LLIQGSLLESRGQTDRAGANYDEALTLARAVGRRMLEADALQFLGILEFKRAQWKESLEHFHAALAISQEEGDREMFGAGLSALASDYQSMGEVRKAIEYLDQALPIFRELSNMFRYSNALYNLGNSYQALDDYPKAIGYYREALPILSKMNSPLGQAYILMAMGHAYRAMGDDDRADSYFRQATGMWRKTGEKQGESFALNASAALALQSRNYSQAIDLYQQSLAISHDAGFQRQESSALAAISEVYMTEKDAHHSLDLAIQAGALADKIGAQQQRAVALYQEGRARRALHDYAAAREALEQANALMGVVGSRVQQTNVVFELAALDRDTGSLEAGRDRILKSLDSLEQTGASVGSAESRMLFAASHRKSFDLAVDIEMQMHETGEALELSERARARELVDLIRGARLDIRQGADPRLLDRERRVQELLDAKHDRLMRMLEASHAPALEAQARKEIDELLQQYRDTEDEIRRQSPRYGALIEPRVFSLGDLQAELPGPDTALIEFWLGQERSYAWLVTKKSVEGFELPTRDAIESAARRAYASLDARNVEREESLAARKQRVSEADREFAQSAAELSKMLLGPIQGISGMRRLWVVSDGALEYLPFAALPMPGAQTPLVATHEILRLPSASVMAEMSSEASARRPAPLSVAVFADPVFRADDERVANVGARQASDPPRAASDVDLFNLPRLYFSRQEADAIRTLGGGEKTREILDFDASRVEAEKPSLRDYRVIHFATHALLDSKNPELSGLVLSMIDRQGRPQDGFLRLHEIYNLKLNADLVVLSACRTALGPEVQGEGLIGLTRGFMYAGAPQVLASLWSIRDNATTWFMTKFYEALLKRHQTPEAALRAAQLAMMKDSRWSQPYYWAAFTVQGAR
jgi:CHAT domain-containing protein